jgi:hypothetical protein
MQSSGDANMAGAWVVGAGVAAEVLRQHRTLVSAYTTPPEPTEEPADAADDGGSTVTAPPAPAQPAPQPLAALTRADLPAPLLDLITRYEARSPGVHLVPLRLVSIGRPDEAATLGDAVLPSDADLVSLTVTQTVVSQDQIEVTSLVLLAARSGQAPG